MNDQPSARAKRIAEAVAKRYRAFVNWELEVDELAEAISTSGLAELEAERDGYKTMVCSQSCKMHYPPPDGEPSPWADLEARLAAAERERNEVRGRESYLELVIEAFVLQHPEGVSEASMAAAKLARERLATEKGE